MSEKDVDGQISPPVGEAISIRVIEDEGGDGLADEVHITWGSEEHVGAIEEAS